MKYTTTHPERRHCKNMSIDLPSSKKRVVLLMKEHTTSSRKDYLHMSLGISYPTTQLHLAAMKPSKSGSSICTKPGDPQRNTRSSLWNRNVRRSTHLYRSHLWRKRTGNGNRCHSAEDTHVLFQ